MLSWPENTSWTRDRAQFLKMPYPEIPSPWYPSLSSFPIKIIFFKTINSNSFNEITSWNYYQGKGETGDLLECPLSYKHRIMQLFMVEKTLKNSLACSVGGWCVAEGGWSRDVRRHGGSKFMLSETRRSCSGVCTSESQGGLPLLLHFSPPAPTLRNQRIIVKKWSGLEGI